MASHPRKPVEALMNPDETKKRCPGAALAFEQRPELISRGRE
jgi:hypothetical protein